MVWVIVNPDRRDFAKLIVYLFETIFIYAACNCMQFNVSVNNYFLTNHLKVFIAKVGRRESVEFILFWMLSPIHRSYNCPEVSTC